MPTTPRLRAAGAAIGPGAGEDRGREEDRLAISFGFRGESLRQESMVGSRGGVSVHTVLSAVGRMSDDI